MKTFKNYLLLLILFCIAFYFPAVLEKIKLLNLYSLFILYLIIGFGIKYCWNIKYVVSFIILVIFVNTFTGIYSTNIKGYEGLGLFLGIFYAASSIIGALLGQYVRKRIQQKNEK
ncbi:MAG: hypothetical protein A2252_05845 [Elusimicrobia bacterium RIFOXYA2_FULL_39_19]|nr:MAG: hypothetical protein A2252_05845 [Elusimicrobia bacterium RIFOXYA2_FULL_39_19]